MAYFFVHSAAIWSWVSTSVRYCWAMLPTKGSSKKESRIRGYFRMERTEQNSRTWVAISQKRANRENHLGDGQSRTPVVFQNVQANFALAVDVAVINPSLENHLRRLEWIIWGEGDVEEKYTRSIGRVCGTHDSCHPFKNIIALGAGGAIAWWIQTDLCKFLLNSSARKRMIKY